AVILGLQLPATFFIDGVFTLDFISIARSLQFALALSLTFLTIRNPIKNYLNIFLGISIIIQVIATIKFEPQGELNAYNFIAVLVIISAVTFKGNLKQWFMLNFPIHLSAL